AETDPDLVHFEVDLYWTWYAHRDPVQLLGAFGDRIRQFHVKDMRYVDHLPSWADVGTGVIDFARIFAAAGDPSRHQASDGGDHALRARCDGARPQVHRRARRRRRARAEHPRAGLRLPAADPLLAARGPVTRKP